MLFHSVNYIFFFIFVSFVYYLIPGKWQKIWLIMTSYLFYALWDWRYTILLLLLTLITWRCGIVLRADSRHQVVRILKLYIIGVLVFLVAAKYLRLIYDKIGFLGDRNIEFEWEILFPIGASFYVLQAISYIVDVYKGKINPEYTLSSFALYMCFFPKLVSGPIERGENFLPQTRLRYHYKSIDWGGCRYILYGYFKKICIADMAAFYVNQVWNNLDAYAGVAVIAAVMLYSIQLYCDFSGYSDIAVGCAKLLGYNLTENFRFPYFSVSIKEFWSRWHISLSSWLKDYIYIPLGGAWKHKNVNLIATFLVSGIWHGTGFTYMLWGVLHGLLLVWEKGGHEKLLQGIKFLRMFVVFFIVSILWIPFRAASIPETVLLFQKMTQLQPVRSSLVGIFSVIDATGLFSGKISILIFACYLFLSILILVLVESYCFRHNCNIVCFFQNIGIRQRYLLYIIFEVLVLICFIFQDGGFDSAKRFIYMQY